MAQNIVQFPAMPSFLATRQRQNASFTENMGSPRIPYISIADNRFTLIDKNGDETPINTLDINIVFLAANPKNSKRYYAKAYGGKTVEFTPPDCFSDNGVGPSSQSSKPQNHHCLGCPHDVFGSGQNGKGKACQDAKRTVCLVPGIGKGLYMFRVTPGSFENWKVYNQFLASGGNVSLDVTQVVTRVSFESQGILKFEPAGYYDEAVFQEMDEWYKSPTLAEYLALNDQVHGGPFAGGSAGSAPPTSQGQSSETASQSQGGFSSSAPPQTGFGQSSNPTSGHAQSAATEPPKRERKSKANGFVDNPAPPPTEVTDALKNAFNFNMGG